VGEEKLGNIGETSPMELTCWCTW